MDCPACSQSALRKKISAAGFRLKGGGWYETDFKKNNKRNLAGSANDGDKSNAPAKPEKKTAKPGKKTAKSTTGSQA